MYFTKDHKEQECNERIDKHSMLSQRCDNLNQIIIKCGSARESHSHYPNADGRIKNGDSKGNAVKKVSK